MSDGKKQVKIKDQVEDLAKQIKDLHMSNVALATQVENLRLSTMYLKDRLDAVVSLSERESKLSKDDVEQEVISRNIELLKGEVQRALEAGALTKSDIIGHRSFIVAKETEKESGKIIQPRVQVSMMSMPPEVQQDFVGKSVGDIVEKDSVEIEVQEIYDITEAPEKA
jgi:hypothetical protein